MVNIAKFPPLVSSAVIGILVIGIDTANKLNEILNFGISRSLSATLPQ